jgi:cbb3-type cytochrome c oxidase subunit III
MSTSRSSRMALGVSVLMFMLLAIAYAQQAAPSGEEVYVDRLGCWNCHGKSGGGGAGATISKTKLPLRRFVGYVRLPSKEMPPYAPLLASDEELAIVYRWLDGVESLKTPPPITIDLKSPTGVRADGQAKADVEVAVANASAGGGAPEAAALRYRVTLSSANTPLANQGIEYQLAGHDEWSKFTTDEHGEAVVTPNGGFVKLRTALASGRTVLVVEALDYTTAANPVVIGIGSAVLKVE